MTAPLELSSIEQLISALNKKLLKECARVQSAMPPESRGLVATLASEIDALEKQSNLPPEVLTSCAAFVSATDPRPIVPLTHVCRYWRSSISSNPRSWASTSTGWKRLTPLCLERSGAAPLTFDIRVSDARRNQDFLELLLPQIPRIYSLRLTGYPFIEVVAGDLPGFFDPPMPNLTSLELQQMVEPAESSLVGGPIPPIFQNVSKLVSLRLIRTPLYPTVFKITSLKELKLGYTNPFHFGTLIGFLDSHPALELVVLEIRFAPGSVETALTRKVTLPRLQHLSITCSNAIDSKGLLSCISLPRGVHLEVEFTRSDQHARLGSFLPPPPTPIQDLLALGTTIKTRVTPHELCLFGNDSVFTFRPTSALLGVRPELSLFPSTTVRELYTHISPLRYYDLSVMLEMLPGLETLAFSETDFPSRLFHALTREPVLCPALRTIALFNCEANTNAVKRLGEAVAKRRDPTAARVVIVISSETPPDLTSVERLRKSGYVWVDDELPDLS